MKEESCVHDIRDPDADDPTDPTAEDRADPPLQRKKRKCFNHNTVIR